MKIDNSPARGMRDILPGDVRKRTETLATIVDTYTKFGYQRIETPAVESIERLTAGSSGSENQKLIYQILKRGLDDEAGKSVNELVDLGLRFDLTVPLARYFANNQASLRMPFRALQAAPVWRAERPQKGRYRQFMQCDIDIIGEPSVLAEIELITATMQALNNLGITSAVVNVSDRRVLAAVAEQAEIDTAARASFFISLDKLDKIGWDGVREEFSKVGISQSGSEKAIEIVEQLSASPINEVATTISKLLPSVASEVVDALGLTLSTVESSGTIVNFDPSLVRGMGYYTGQVFEVRSDAYDSSLAGGGRYDDLLTASVGKQVPACGFSIGFERITELLGDKASKSGLAVLFDKDVDLATVMNIAEKYRSEGYDVSIVPQSGSAKAQIDRLVEWEFESFVYLQSGKTDSPEVKKL